MNVSDLYMKDAMDEFVLPFFVTDKKVEYKYK